MERNGGCQAMDRRHQFKYICRQAADLARRPASFDRLFTVSICFVCAGCSTAPKSFLSMNDPAAINRARAVAFGQSAPDTTAIPVLIDRLSDDDPVVRLASHEALKKRTGQDFGYQPYNEGDELTAAVSRWQNWWSNTQQGRMVAGSRGIASPQASPQIMPRQALLSQTPVSEATYRQNRGLFQRMFQKRQR